MSGERTSGAVDQEAFEQVILDNLSPEGVGKQVTIRICTIRPATADEIQLQRWHNQMVAAEGK